MSRQPSRLANKLILVVLFVPFVLVRVCACAAHSNLKLDFEVAVSAELAAASKATPKVTANHTKPQFAVPTSPDFFAGAM